MDNDHISKVLKMIISSGKAASVPVALLTQCGCKLTDHPELSFQIEHPVDGASTSSARTVSPTQAKQMLTNHEASLALKKPEPTNTTPK